MESIKVNGNFAVKVGNMWAKRSYNEVNLTKQPDALTDFKQAYALSKEIGGKVYMFKPAEISDEEMENLILASQAGEGEE